MRYPASEKLEIIRLVEESHLSARLTLAKLGIPRTTFYRWYDRYLQRGEAGLEDQSPKPKQVWNRVPDEVKQKVVNFGRLSVSFYLMSEHNLDVEPGILDPLKQQLVLENKDEVLQTRTVARKLSKDALKRIGGSDHL